MSRFQAFEEAERDGWSDVERASGYVNLFASASDMAIQPLLDAVAATQGDRVLDLCCGQGNVSEALNQRGCEIVGLDFSPPMLAQARNRVSDAIFLEGDAQALPFEDKSFDVVVSNLGVCHVADQPTAVSEIARVLRPGGRFAMTVWCGPDKSPCFELVYGAVKQHGSSDVSAPPGPDFHQFANPVFAEQTLTNAGFAQVTCDVVDCAWILNAPDGLFDIFAKGTVRAAMLLASQPVENLTAIRTALTEGVRERFKVGETWRVPIPAALLRASIPSSD